MRAPRIRVQALLPWLGLMLAIGLLSVLVWFLFGRGRASAVELVAWDRDSFSDELARLSPQANDPLGAGTPRVPLVLALRNRSPVTLRVTRVTLTLPSWLRLEYDDGEPLAFEADGGNPLMRWTVPLEPVRLEPNRPPTVLDGARRLWIRPFSSPWRCTLDDAGLPAFRPAPPLDPVRLANPILFWVAEEAGGGRRATGTLRLSLDPAAFAFAPVETPPVFPALELPADSPRPDLGRMPVEGTRTIECGGMIEPLTLHSTVYRPRGGGRIVSVSADDAPARLLFDLDGDDTIEAEAWAQAAGGRIDRVRRTHYPVPGFLLPPPPPPPADTVPANPDSVTTRPDTAAAATPRDTTGSTGGPA